MPSTYSNLKIQLMATGENSTTWGNVTNLNLGTAIEEAIAGSADVTFASANVTLTLTDTNTSQTARNMRLRCTGTTGGSTRNLVVPAIEKAYMVQNDCADSVVVKNATGTGITVPAGKTMWVYNDGTNVVDAVNHLSSLSMPGNLQFTSTGQRILGDFSNATITNRTSFQSSGTNQATAVNALPNGTATQTNFVCFNASDPTNASFTSIVSTATEARLVSSITGTGTYLPLTLYTGGSERMRVDTSGNVGIGTSSPGAALDVVGSVRASSTLLAGAIQTGFGVSTGDCAVEIGGDRTGSGNSYIDLHSTSGTDFETRILRNSGANGVLDLLNTGTGAFNISQVGAAPLVFKTTDTERMRISNTGNVGIGTSTPETMLDLNGSQIARGDGSGYVYFAPKTGTAPFGTNYDRFEIRVNPTVQETTIGNTHGGTGSPRALAFLSGGSERMRIDTAGNVGIGTSTPEQLLTVRYDHNGATAALIQNRNASGSPAAALQFISGAFDLTDDRYAMIASAGGANNTLQFYTSQGATPTEKMRIDSSGNVGIGTASPAAKLDVNGQTVTGNITVRGDGSEGGQISLNDKANTAATYNFDVDSGGHGRLFTTNSSTNLTIGQLGGTGGNVIFYTANAERMRISSIGYVGVGTSTPSAHIHTQGFASYRGNAYTLATFCANSTLAPLNIVQATDGTIPGISAGQNSTATFADLGFYTSETERFRIAANGAFGLSGANYGTSGQVLTSQGSGSAPIWTSITPGTGTVTSVSFTGGIVSVGTPTTTPAFTVAGTSGGIPYFSSASTWATSAALAANAIVVGGGAGVAPSTITTGTGVVTALGVNTGTAGAFVVNGGALGTPSSGTLTNCTFPTLNQNTTGSAATLTTARTLTIGATGKTFNGSANVTWTLAELGAAASGANTDITSLATTTTINGVTIGYRSIPRSTTTTTAVVGDVGKCIAVTAGITIPNSTFAAGDALSIYNDSASAITITAGVTTLRQAGTANTGNRTLAARGMATVWFNSATEAIISGSGLT
jgi:hypothetical protein